MVVAAVDDDVLMARIGGGDRAAEHELYLDHHGYAIRVAMSRGAQVSDAEDLVQEAFIRVLRHLRRGNRPRGPFRPYLNAAVRNVAADVHRRRSSREYPTGPETLLTDTPHTSIEPHDEIEIRTIVQGAMATLPGHAREMLWSLHVEGHSLATVAADAGVTTQTMAARASRARRTLRLAIGHPD